MLQALEYSMKLLRTSDESFAFSDSVPPSISRTTDAFSHAFLSAKKSGDLCFYVQPKKNLHNNTLVGAEVLLRWYDNAKGSHHPISAVIEWFERHNMMDTLAIFTLDYVIEILQSEISIPISLNLSLSQLSSKRVIDYYNVIALRHSTLIKNIEIEVTEEALFENHSNSLRNLNKLCSMGYLLAIDDFGKGYSNFNRIIEIKPRTVKIDKIFIDSVTHCLWTQNVIEALVMIVKSQNSMLVAEGIETQEQVDVLCKLGIVVGQGFHLGRPMPKNAFITKFW
jgi:EAL domain-containing protein (putative c-di-GMP-specific phosphodiesterase class I)